MCKFWLPPAVLLLTALTGFADTITLKSGEHLEGKITAETPKDVTIDVQVSEGVIDERTIVRDDISTLQKTTPDELAYQQLKNLRLPTNEMTTTALDGQVGALTNFCNTYPQSPHLAEVQATLVQFNADRLRLDGGEVKAFGKWLSKSEAYRQRYEIQAQGLYDAMEAQVEARDLVGSLNTFAQIEKNYSGARIFPDAVNRSHQVVLALHGEVVRLLQAWHHDEEERVKGLELTREPEKSELIAAAKAEVDRYGEAMDAAVASGVKWVPLIARSEKSLLNLQAATEAEDKRLLAIPVAAMLDSVSNTDKAATAIQEKDAVTAEGLLKDAATAWPTNHRLGDLQADLAALNVELHATPTPTPTPKATPKPSPRPTPPPVAVVAPPPPSPPDSGILSMLMSPIGLLVGGGLVVLAAGGGLLAARARKQKIEALE